MLFPLVAVVEVVVVALLVQVGQVPLMVVQEALLTHLGLTLVVA
jgi:hypothetical protein